MGLVTSLIAITSLLIVIGAIFALPMYLPVVRQFAHEALLRRRLMIAITSIFTFIVCFMGVAYMDALVTKTFSTPVSGIERPFADDSQQGDLLVRELWLQNIVMPSERAHCYTGDVAVCDASQSIEANLAMDANTEYVILLAHGILAAMSNIYFVSYILREKRKKKVPTLVTG